MRDFIIDFKNIDQEKTFNTRATSKEAVKKNAGRIPTKRTYVSGKDEFFWSKIKRARIE